MIVLKLSHKILHYMVIGIYATTQLALLEHYLELGKDVSNPKLKNAQVCSIHKLGKCVNV